MKKPKTECPKCGKPLMVGYSDFHHQLAYICSSNKCDFHMGLDVEPTEWEEYKQTIQKSAYDRHAKVCGKVNRMSETNGKVCCNCRHNIRTTDGENSVTCTCEIDKSNIGYIKCMTHWCRHWATDEKHWEEVQDDNM